MLTVGTAAPADTDDAQSPWSGASRLVATVVLGVLLLPLVVTALRSVLDDPPAPSGDVALIELRVRDVGEQTPLLGS